MKRIISFGLACMLAFASVANVSAAGAQPPAPQEYETQVYGDCRDHIPAHYHGGNFHDAGTLTIGGIEANIDTNSSTGPCTFNQGNDSASQWVSIVPGSTNSYYGNQTAILQIGIARCNFYSSNSTCNDNSPYAPRYFWAIGGCNGYTPYARSLGAANYNVHSYKINRVSISGNIYWQLSIDGDVRVEIPIGDNRIDCWSEGDTRALWAGETFDAGDSWGSSGAEIEFYDLDYRVEGGAWVDLTWSASTACNLVAQNTVELDNKCDRETNGAFELWSEAL